MKVIDQINGSALFAQSAYSAAVATKDDLGRDITATYLTAHQSLDGYATTSDLEQVSAEVTDKLDTTAQVISSCETSSIGGETLVTKLNGNEIAVGYAASARIANIALKDYQGNSFVPFYAKTSALEEKLDTTAFSNVSGDFLTAHQSLSDYYTKDETSGKEELAQAFANIPGGGTEVNAYVHNNSASIDGTTSVVQSNSSTWSDITAYQSSSATLNEVSTAVQTNSAQWSQGGGVTGDYVPLSATVVGIGSANSASDKDTFAQGTSNTAQYRAFAQGVSNSADTYSLVQGGSNTATNWSLAQGYRNSADYYSFAQGSYNSAGAGSVAQGDYNSAYIDSLAVGTQNVALKKSMAVGNNCVASECSQAFGWGLSATNSGMAIGTYNNTTSAAFVIGNGTNPGDYSLVTRSDCFVIDHGGNVTAEGKIIASGLELPGSHFKVDTDGRAYKLEVLDSIEQTLTTGNFSANNTLGYRFGKDKHYVVQVPDTRVSFEVHPNTILNNIDPEIICSGVVQDGVCDFVYPSTGVTGRKWFITKNIYTTASLTTANCKLYTISSVSPSGMYVLSSELPTYEYDDTNKISAINGSALAGGGDVPISAEEWNSNYETVNTNSGAWGGSALPISAGPGIKVNLVDNTLVFSNDETVLWEGTAFTPAGGNNPVATSVSLNENFNNFNQIRLDFSNGELFTDSVLLTEPTTARKCYICVKKEQLNNDVFVGTHYKFTSDTTLSGYCSYGSTQNIEAMNGGYWGYGGVVRVVGINRK